MTSSPKKAIKQARSANELDIQNKQNMLDEKERELDEKVELLATAKEDLKKTELLLQEELNKKQALINNLSQRDLSIKMLNLDIDKLITDIKTMEGKVEKTREDRDLYSQKLEEALKREKALTKEVESLKARVAMTNFAPDISRIDTDDDLHEDSMELVQTNRERHTMAWKDVQNLIPNYSGNEDLTAWFFLLEDKFKMCGIKSEEKVDLAKSYLRGAALTLYMTIREDGPLSFEKFKAELLAIFQPFDNQTTTREELGHLKQEGNDFDEYVRRFQRLIIRLKNATEFEKIFFFKNGLSRGAAERVRELEPKTLLEAMKIARNFEKSIRRPPMQQFVPRRPVPPMQKRPMSTPNRERPPTRRCYTCNNEGHISTNCPNKANAQRSNQFNHKPRENRNPNASAFMVASHQHKHSQLLSVTGTVLGKKVELVLDTGATVSLISERWAKKEKAKLDKYQGVLEIADPQAVAVSQKLSKTQVEVHGIVATIDMIVRDLPENVTGILGLDWLKKVRAVLDVGSRVLIFKEKAVSLVDGTSVQILNGEDPEDCLLTEETIEEDDADDEQMWTGTNEITDENLSADLSPEEKQLVTELIRSHSDVFATSYMTLGCSKVGEHHIRTMQEQPIYQHPFRKSVKERQMMQEEVSKMLEAHVIRPSMSAWSFPVVIIKKKDGTLRFCVDYRKLNAITIADAFPLPRIDDIFDRLSGSKWFSTIDLKSGYWQVKMAEDSISKTAFSTPDGHYEFLRLPFGLKNAPAEFSRIMHQVFGDLKFVQIYLDDLTIHSLTFEEHLEHLRIVFERILIVNLRLNLKKCEFFKKEIKLLGHIIGRDSLKMDPEKIRAIRELREPKNIKQVQQFLGLCGYYRRFIMSYAEIVAPLFALLRKETIWHWGADQQVAFDTLKRKLVEEPILRQPDFTKQFYIYTDASNAAIGAILAQKQDDNAEYVVSYASRLLKGAEIHYGITEKECLGVLWAIRHFRVYVTGVRFTVVTDHAALVWLMNINDPTGRLARWSLFLQAFDFDIVHKKGSTHSNVDTLSRPVLLVNDKPHQKEPDSLLKG